MLEFLFEILGEFLLQIVVEVLVEWGLQSLAAPFRRETSPWLAAIGYAVFGALLGGLSLLVVPYYLMHARTLRLANLVLTPIAVGLLMSLTGAWRAKRGQAVLRIDRFACGYLFALSMGLVRFFYAD